MGEEKSGKIESAKKSAVLITERFDDVVRSKSLEDARDDVVKRRRRCSFCAYSLIFSLFAVQTTSTPVVLCAQTSNDDDDDVGVVSLATRFSRSFYPNDDFGDERRRRRV